MGNLKDQDFYSIKQFAAILGFHPNTIRRAIYMRKIEFIRIGIGPKASYRIAKSEISRMISFDLRLMIDGLVEKKLREME